MYDHWSPLHYVINSSFLKLIIINTGIALLNITAVLQVFRFYIDALSLFY